MKEKVKRMGLITEVWERVNLLSGRSEPVAKNTIYLALENPSTPFRKFVCQIAEDMIAARERQQQKKIKTHPADRSIVLPGGAMMSESNYIH